MKKIYYAVMLLVSILTNVEAQTFNDSVLFHVDQASQPVITNAVTYQIVIQPPTNSPYRQLGKDLWNIAKQAAPSTNDFYTLSLGYGQNAATHENIEAGMLSIVNTNGTGVSLIGGRIGSEWEYGGGAFSIGRVDNWFLVGQVHESIGDGVIYDWQTHNPANYLFTRVTKEWNVGSRFNVGLGVMVANRSNAKGVDVIGGSHFGFHF